MKNVINIIAQSISYILIILLLVLNVLMYKKIDNLTINYDEKIKSLEENNADLSDKIKDLEQQEIIETPIEDTTYDITSFDKIKSSQIESLSKGKTIVIMIGREGCGWCARYAPVLKNTQEKYDFKAKYIDLATIISMQTWQVIDEESHNILMNLDAVDEYKSFMAEEFGATPLTIIVKDNKIINAIAGYIDEDTLSSILEISGFSK